MQVVLFVIAKQIAIVGVTVKYRMNGDDDNEVQIVVVDRSIYR